MRLDKGDELNGYTVVEGERNDEAGKSVYAFAEKDGAEYFVKKFIHIRYPEEPDLLGPELTKLRLDECELFEKRQRSVTDLLGTAAENYGIVRTLDFFREGTDYYRIARRVRPVDDRTPLSTHGSSGAISLLQGIASAIGYFHSVGLVHGDIKLENVLIEDRGGTPMVAVIDFDDCYVAGDPPAASVLGGTPSHFAPEVVAYIRSSGQTPPPGLAADVFSAALVMHELVVGRIPRFATRDQMLGLSLLRGAPMDLSMVAAPLADVLRPMLAVDPEDRPTLESVYRQITELDDDQVVAAAARDDREIPVVPAQEATETETETPAQSFELDEPLDPKLKINMRRRPES